MTFEKQDEPLVPLSASDPCAEIPEGVDRRAFMMRGALAVSLVLC